MPGNLELDLHAAGAVPEPFFGMNIVALRAFENSHASYARRFDVTELPASPACPRFEGVDCYADYFLNGQAFGTSDNALVKHEFDVREVIRRGVNELVVHLRPVGPEAARYDYPASAAAHCAPLEADSP